MSAPYVVALGYTTVPLSYDKQVQISKHDLPYLPPGFTASTWSLPLGARAVYRDERATDSIQLRDYGTHWTAQLDRYNPEAGPVEWASHALTDAIHVTLGVIALVGGVAALAVGAAHALRSR